jgi:hypothetical protein
MCVMVVSHWLTATEAADSTDAGSCRMIGARKREAGTTENKIELFLFHPCIFNLSGRAVSSEYIAKRSRLGRVICLMLGLGEGQG